MTCGKCGKPLRYDNRSGHCREHFTAAINTAERTRRSVERRLSWCPREYRGLYRDLTYRKGMRAPAAKAMVIEQVKRDWQFWRHG